MIKFKKDITYHIGVPARTTNKFDAGLQLRNGFVVESGSRLLDKGIEDLETFLEQYPHNFKSGDMVIVAIEKFDNDAKANILEKIDSLTYFKPIEKAGLSDDMNMRSEFIRETSRGSQQMVEHLKQQISELTREVQRLKEENNRLFEDKQEWFMEAHILQGEIKSEKRLHEFTKNKLTEYKEKAEKLSKEVKETTEALNDGSKMERTVEQLATVFTLGLTAFNSYQESKIRKEQETQQQMLEQLQQGKTIENNKPLEARGNSYAPLNNTYVG